jgi:hypothetical protein
MNVRRVEAALRLTCAPLSSCQNESWDINWAELVR